MCSSDLEPLDDLILGKVTSDFVRALVKGNGYLTFLDYETQVSPYSKIVVNSINSAVGDFNQKLISMAKGQGYTIKPVKADKIAETITWQHPATAFRL